VLSFRLFQHRHSRFACPKAVHRKNQWRRSKIQSFFQLSTSKGLLLSMLMVLAHGPKLQRFWQFLAFKWIISIKNMLPQFVRCPKDCRTSVEHRPLIQIGNRWDIGFPRKLPQKEGTGDLVTHSSKLEQRVWQWMWRRTILRSNNSEKLAAMSKLFNGWSSFWDVRKQACKAAYAIPVGNSRAHP